MRNRLSLQWCSFKAKRILLWVVPCQKLVKQSSQAVDVCSRSCLRSSILFWGGIAWGAERDSIHGLSWLKVASNAKVNQVEMTGRCAHHIGWLEITEDDGRLSRMEIVKHSTKLNTNSEDFLRWQTPTPCSIQVPLQRLTFDEVCHEIPVLSISEVVVYTWQVGECQVR